MSDAHVPSRDRTAVDLSLLIVRVIGGVIMSAHGAQKLFGAFGGPGLAAVAEMMGPVAYPVAIGEFFGGLGIALGFLSRFSALANIGIMIGAIAMVHGKNGFFLSNPGMGYEFNLALIGLFAPVLLCGPGRYSVGRVLPLPKRAGSDRPIVVLE
jgi:putative oxidoreductase